MVNKYERKPQYILDLHGYTTSEAQKELDDLFKNSIYSHVRIITGKGAFRATGPVLQTFVKQYLFKKGYRYNPAKLQDGGEGAFEVFVGR
ncbi:MAG: Smr/MutS family protein [bacterium]|nr:Smr/MutS family protein [bacterium]